MGLTIGSVGMRAMDGAASIAKAPGDYVIAIAGNPNVGKSTVFNALTGMRQHTGNWPGKTVSNAQGTFRTAAHSYTLVDIPGTYSLAAHSQEEEVARDFICFGAPDAVIVVCDATCLERNLNLTLQIMEVCPRVLVCVNLVDEARRKGIRLDMPALSQELGAPVVGTVARDRRTLRALTDALDSLIESPPRPCLNIAYPAPVEEAAARLTPVLTRHSVTQPNARWLSLRLLEGDAELIRSAEAVCGAAAMHGEIADALGQARALLAIGGCAGDALRDAVTGAFVSEAERICARAVASPAQGYGAFDRRMDRLLTSRRTGYPAMLLLLALIFYITIAGANYPSALLTRAFGHVESWLGAGLIRLNAPEWLRSMLTEGVWRVLAWVVAVMLPPMAIFFPLFTLLEDAGYLPRVAYNLDKPFKRCRTCGKQCLTMCMGLGCNAAGVMGCRIIDSPRERLIAILTNSFMPCNGRFPTLISLLTMFFIAAPASGALGGVLAALGLTGLIVLSVLVTLGASYMLSRMLRGMPSSFTLELPPYRRPQIGQVIVRSVCDRTLFVLGRAAAVAAPAGLIIWLLANAAPGGLSLLSRFSAFLDPFARLMGLDGVILMAFILGFPANEIVLPLAVMGYLAQGSLSELGNLNQVRALLVANGWTWLTALNVMLFSLMHWPCSTTLLTIRRETGSARWTAVALLLPTAMGMGACMLTTLIARIFAL